jgi:hypothetical protein
MSPAAPKQLVCLAISSFKKVSKNRVHGLSVTIKCPVALQHHKTMAGRWSLNFGPTWSRSLEVTTSHRQCSWWLTAPVATDLSGSGAPDSRLPRCSSWVCRSASAWKPWRSCLVSGLEKATQIKIDLGKCFENMMENVYPVLFFWDTYTWLFEVWNWMRIAWKLSSQFDDLRLL